MLEHLGLGVNRLIRVSFGPFQLGELAEGDGRRKSRRGDLREQLGEQIVSQAEADFDRADRDVRSTREASRSRRECEHPRRDRRPRTRIQQKHGIARIRVRRCAAPGMTANEAARTHDDGRQPSAQAAHKSAGPTAAADRARKAEAK